jgi:hypothetical protein
MEKVERGSWWGEKKGLSPNQFVGGGNREFFKDDLRDDNLSELPVCLGLQTFSMGDLSFGSGVEEDLSPFEFPFHGVSGDGDLEECIEGKSFGVEGEALLVSDFLGSGICREQDAVLSG